MQLQGRTLCDVLDHDGGKEKENQEPDGEQQGMGRESMTGWEKQIKGDWEKMNPKEGQRKGSGMETERQGEWMS